MALLGGLVSQATDFGPRGASTRKTLRSNRDLVSTRGYILSGFGFQIQAPDHSTRKTLDQVSRSSQKSNFYSRSSLPGSGFQTKERDRSTRRTLGSSLGVYSGVFSLVGGLVSWATDCRRRVVITRLEELWSQVSGSTRKSVSIRRSSLANYGFQVLARDHLTRRTLE